MTYLHLLDPGDLPLIKILDRPETMYNALSRYCQCAIVTVFFRHTSASTTLSIFISSPTTMTYTYRRDLCQHVVYDIVPLCTRIQIVRIILSGTNIICGDTAHMCYIQIIVYIIFIHSIPKIVYINVLCINIVIYTYIYIRIYYAVHPFTVCMYVCMTVCLSV